MTTRLKLWTRLGTLAAALPLAVLSMPAVPAGAGADRLFASAAHVGAQVRHLKQSVPTLEDVFAQAVGEE